MIRDHVTKLVSHKVHKAEENGWITAAEKYDTDVTACSGTRLTSFFSIGLDRLLLLDSNNLLLRPQENCGVGRIRRWIIDNSLVSRCNRQTGWQQEGPICLSSIRGVKVYGCCWKLGGKLADFRMVDSCIGWRRIIIATCIQHHKLLRLYVHTPFDFRGGYPKMSVSPTLT